MNLSECLRISVDDIIKVFTEYKDRHDEKQGPCSGRKLALCDLVFNECGPDPDYWEWGEDLDLDV
jgi:hypothetical protein